MSSCTVLSSSNLTSLTGLTDMILTRGSHFKQTPRISATICSLFFSVIPSYRYRRSFEPNSGFNILSPGTHVKMFLRELNTALTLISFVVQKDYLYTLFGFPPLFSMNTMFRLSDVIDMSRKTSRILSSEYVFFAFEICITLFAI